MATNEIMSAEEFRNVIATYISGALEWNGELFPGNLKHISDLIKARDAAIRAEHDAKYAKVVELAELVSNWVKAYPPKLFKEPSSEEMQKVCSALGITMDCVSASILREFTKPWGDMANAALTELSK